MQTSVDLAKADALKQQLTDSEIKHVGTCIQIIHESAEELKCRSRSNNGNERLNLVWISG